MDEQIKSSNDAYKKKIKFNEHLKMAKAAFVNKNYDVSTENIAKAIQIFPDNLDAREVAADLLWVKGKVSSAASEYKSIFDSDNTRVKVEEKYAKAVLAVYDEKQRLQQMDELLHGKKTPEDKVSSWKIFVSAIIPGLGAVLQENFTKGIVVLLLYLVFAGMAVNSVSKENFFQMFKSPFSYISGIIWIYSFIDTIVQYKKNK